MSFLPITQATVETYFKTVRLVATDMDSTLTIAGKFSSHLLQSLEHLLEAKIPVLIVTGRSAGWVSGVAHYLPVWGAIAENGGMVYAGATDAGKLLVPIPNVTTHRQQLAQTFERLKAKFPGLQESTDNRFRLTDWTFDVQGLTIAEIQQISRLCHDWGWGFTYSTVQCHIKLKHQDKAVGVLQVLQQHFPHLTPTQVMTVGDSPNDESLFDACQFPLSVGVANAQHYREQLAHRPKYVTAGAEGKGFEELTQFLLNSR